MFSFNQNQYITRIADYVSADSLTTTTEMPTVDIDTLGTLTVSEATGILRVASGDFAFGGGSETVYTSFDGSRLSLGAGDDTVVVLGDSEVLLGDGQDTIVMAPA